MCMICQIWFSPTYSPWWWSAWRGHPSPFVVTFETSTNLLPSYHWARLLSVFPLGPSNSRLPSPGCVRPSFMWTLLIFTVNLSTPQLLARHWPNFHRVMLVRWHQRLPTIWVWNAPTAWALPLTFFPPSLQFLLLDRIYPTSPWSSPLSWSLPFPSWYPHRFFHWGI